MKKLIRTSTVPTSLNTFCKGLFAELTNEGWEVVAISSPGAELEELGHREGIKTVGVPMERHISPLKDLKSLWRLIKVFRKEKPDMVHSITPKAGLLSMIAAWICRVPVRLHTFTGLVFPTSSGIKRKVLVLTDRLTCACATHIVPEGEGVKNDLIDNHITKKPLKVLGFGNIKGIDLEHFNSSAGYEKPAPLKDCIQEGDFIFVFVGRLVGDKGINELIQAFKQLAEKYPNAKLLLVGPTEQNLDPLKEETLMEIENNPNILAVGNQADVRPWLAFSDALVFPSYREGFPNVVIEAGAMGLPSIVTDINGSREIINQDKNGVIIPAHDAEALEKAMEYFITNPDKVRKMVENARPMVASRYEQSFVRQCLKDYYREITLKS